MLRLHSRSKTVAAGNKRIAAHVQFSVLLDGVPPRETAPTSGDPFRGVSWNPVSYHHLSPRERALMETMLPAWPRLEPVGGVVEVVPVAPPPVEPISPLLGRAAAVLLLTPVLLATALFTAAFAVCLFMIAHLVTIVVGAWAVFTTALLLYYAWRVLAWAVPPTPTGTSPS